MDLQVKPACDRISQIQDRGNTLRNETIACQQAKEAIQRLDLEGNFEDPPGGQNTKTKQTHKTSTVIKQNKKIDIHTY